MVKLPPWDEKEGRPKAALSVGQGYIILRVVLPGSGFDPACCAVP